MVKGSGKALEDIFWPKVQKTDGCWLWTAAKDEHGYGKMPHGRQTWKPAHRISWLLAHGSLPEELCVLHRCDNPTCVRPDHLFLGTYTDNARDMVAKGRHGKHSDTWKQRFAHRKRHPCGQLVWKVNGEIQSLYRRSKTP